jgi:hypothetical protein
MTSSDKFIHEAKKRAQELEMSFTYREIGHTCELDFFTHKSRGKDSQGFIKGSHLSKVVYADVAKRVASGQYVPKNTNNEQENINTIMFSYINILMNRLKPCVAVDIDSCYFNTAYKIGAISERAYNLGFKQKEKYRHARSVAIGSLGACIYETQYRKGKIVNKIQYRRPFNIVRLDVVEHVWNVAIKIAEQIGPEFFMFLTDCFYVSPNNEQLVYDLLKQEGYTAKSQHIDNITVRRMNRENYEVRWLKENSETSSFHYFNEKHKI